MIFGELAGQSADYQTGHNTGTVRALSYMQQRLRELEQEHPRRLGASLQHVRNGYR